jgi:hypothetical protein
MVPSDPNRSDPRRILVAPARAPLRRFRHERLGRHRSDFVHRGEAPTDGKLVTSLQRDVPPAGARQAPRLRDATVRLDGVGTSRCTFTAAPDHGRDGLAA